MHNVLIIQVSISCYSINNHGLMEKMGIASAYSYEFMNIGQIPKS
jgi:hypothetical protein